MGLKQCAKCSEMVDEAKAFCPGCGNPFVDEEQREQKSEFERSENTVQFGQTMYNQMLSDMGLNLAPTPTPEKRVEVIAPAVPAAVKPAASSVNEAVPNARPVEPSGNKKWYILGGILVVVIIVLTLAATALLYAIWTGYRF